MCNKIKILIFIIGVMTACHSSSDIFLGSYLSNSEIIDNNNFIIAPNNSSISSTNIMRNGIIYTIGYSNDNKIIMISTKDAKFSINGMMIGDVLPKKYLNTKFGYTPGWGYYVKIKLGWYASFSFNSKPNIDSKIDSFFKYDFK